MELSDRVFTLADFRSVDADAAPSTRSSKRQGTQARREDVQRLDQPAALEQWGVPEWVHVVNVEGTDPTDPRSAARTVGKAWVRTGRSRWSSSPSKKKKNKKTL